MADKLIFEVKATSKGLKVVQKDTDKLAKSVERTNAARDKAGKGQNAYNKREKAIHQANLSSAKGFSKMNQTMGGSSGLVGVYATLAANVFAATAAFNALRRAAQLQQLIEGLNMVGAAAGRNLTFAADKLREVSGYAISTDQAMRNMALGVSAGFSTEQMEGLTKVARGASIALGRDMADAIDRLTRGAAKLEPEILDELGIMVRLDVATANYAATIGKGVTQLSQYERRQAFLNEILTQGELKFGQLADSIEPSSYDKLAATLGDLAKAISNLVNKALGPFVDMFAKNMPALIGLVVLFGSTITKQLLPGLSNMAKGGAEAAKASANVAKGQLTQLKVTGKMPAAYMKATVAMQKGELTQKGYNKATKSLTQSNRMHQANIDKDPIKYAKGSAALKAKTAAMRENDVAMKQLNVSYQLHGAAQAKTTLTTALEAVQQKSIIIGYKLMGQAVQEYSAKTMGAVVSSNALNRALAMLKVGFFGVAAAAKTTGAALMAALGWISLVITAAMLLYDAFKDDLWPPDPIADEADAIIKSLDSVKESADSFAKTMNTVADPAHIAVAGYKILTGVLTELKGAMAGFAQSSMAAEGESTAAIEKAIKDQQKLSDEARTEMGKHHWFWDATAHGEAKTAMIAANNQINSLVDDLSENTLEKSQQRATAMGDMVAKVQEGIASQPGFKEFAAVQLDALEQLEKKVRENPSMGAEEIREAIDEILTPVATIDQAFAGATDAAGTFAKEVNKLIQKDRTPFDKIISAAEDMGQKLKDIEKGFAGMGKEGAALPADLAKRRDELIAAIKKQMGIDVTLGESAELDEYIERLITARNTIIESAARVAKLNKQHAKTKDFVKRAGTAEALKVQLDLEEQIRQTKLDGVQAEITATIAAQHNVTDERIAAADRIGNEVEYDSLVAERAKLESDMGDLRVKEGDLVKQRIGSEVIAAKLDVQRIARAKEILNINKQTLSHTKADLANRQKMYENAQLLAAADDPRRRRTTGVETTEGENLQAFYEFQDERRKLILQEYDLKLATIDMEEAIMQAKIALLRAELAAAIEKKEIGAVSGAKILASLGAAPAAMERASAAARTAAESAKDAALSGLQVEERKAKLSAQNALISAGGGADSVALNVRNMQEHWKGLREAAIAKIRKDAINDLLERGKRSGGGPGGVDVSAAAQEAAADAAILSEGEAGIRKEAMEGMGIQEKVEMFKSMTAPMVEQLKALGPEGALAASVVQGAMAITDAWGNVGEVFGRTGEKAASGMEKGAAVAQAVGAGMAAVGNMLAASSQARIAAIDQEIAAEQKRDGKSKGSIAKIAALEKKKEAAKKKAFEVNKKVMMAQTVANTAAAVMQSFVNAGGYPLGIGTAIAMAAIGALQLAVIAGTSYQGGGAVAKPSGPSAVTVGERSNKVDLAKSGGAGEIAYLRGERGTGTSSADYRPGAFAGKRYRAAGGTAYVVGEQGPELFMPEVPGQVVTNDNAAAMGAPTNVSFNVSAIDSTNMQDMLTTQRGSIISMIREAANSHGSGFLENVDVSTYDEGGSI